MGASVSKSSSGEHENALIAESGSSIKFTNINYYNDSCASASSVASLQQDPSKFTQPVVDALKAGEVMMK
nr:VP4 [Enterovirus SEV-gx]